MKYELKLNNHLKEARTEKEFISSTACRNGRSIEKYHKLD